MKLSKFFQRIIREIEFVSKNRSEGFKKKRMLNLQFVLDFQRGLPFFLQFVILKTQNWVVGKKWLI